MDNEQQRKYWFFGSKLNTALLIVLIILMVIAIRTMMKDSATYFPNLNQKKVVVTEQPKQQPSQNGVVFNIYEKNGLYFTYDKRAAEKTLNGSRGQYHEIGILGSGESYYPDTVYFFRGVVPDGASMCDSNNKLESKEIIINNKKFIYCASKAEPYVQYVYKKDGKTVIVGTMLIGDEKMQTYIDLGSIEIN